MCIPCAVSSRFPRAGVLGHESVGIVHQAGAHVTTCKEGDRVVVNAITPCGKCDPCQRGITSQCGGMLGGYNSPTQRDGNMAEYFFVNDADYNVVAIPDDLTDEQALYTTDMMSTGLVEPRTRKSRRAGRWRSSPKVRLGCAPRPARGCWAPGWSSPLTPSRIVRNSPKDGRRCGC